MKPQNQYITVMVWAIFWIAFIDFRRPLEKDGFWAAVYYK